MTLTDLTFSDPARTDAENAAQDVSRQAQRLGLPLEDIEITAPCPTCRRSEYGLAFGPLSTSEALRLANALRAVPTEALRTLPAEER